LSEGIRRKWRIEITAMLTFDPDLQTTWQDWVQSNPMAIRMLLFSAKKSVPLMMQALALEYADELIVGVSLNSVNGEGLLEMLGVPLPTLPSLVFIKGEPEGEPNERGEMGVKLQTQLLESKRLSYVKMVSYADGLADMGRTHMEEMRAKADAMFGKQGSKEEL
jgi:hypothetical protein